MKRYSILIGFALLAALSILLSIKLGWALYGAFVGIQNAVWWAPLIWTPTITVAIVYILQTYVPGAAGTGSPQALLGMDPRCPPDQLHKFISPKIAITKILMTPVAFFAGLSLGNEGPAVQIGASIMSSAKKYVGDISTRALVMIGNGVGIAVCFGSVVGGLLFSIEKSSRIYASPIRFYNYLCVFVAGSVSMWLMGYPHFGVIPFSDISNNNLLIIGITVLLGSVIVADLWVRGLLLVNNKVIAQFKSKHLYLFVGTMGLLVAVIGILTNNLTTGLSDQYTRNLFIEGNDYNLWSVPAKFLACLFTAWSGVSAGMFIPLLTLGGGIGGLIADLFSNGDTALLVSIGMVTFLASVTRAPLASCFIVVDVTGDYKLVLLMLLVAIVSDKIASKISPDLWGSQINTICKQFI